MPAPTAHRADTISLNSTSLDSASLTQRLKAIHRRGQARPLSMAPMMDRTDRHDRYFMRLLSRQALLYTEMITTGAILFGDQGRHLDFSPEEGPLSLQLGGDDPKALAECAKIAEDWGYDEVNLNVGCPSDRVQSGRFGACLMLRPERVAEAVDAMKSSTRIPVTVKHRIGVDERDRYEDMHRFVTLVAEAGCDGFSVHARKAWLSGLSPKENRTVPPLRYEEVYRLKKELPHLFIEINGGVSDWDQIEAHLNHVDGVMLGRAAYQNPRLFMEVDRRLFPDAPASTYDLEGVVMAMADYLDRWVRGGGRAHHVTRHIVHLLSGIPGNKHWRRTLSEGATSPEASGDLIRETWRAVVRLRADLETRAQARLTSST